MAGVQVDRRLHGSTLARNVSSRLGALVPPRRPAPAGPFTARVLTTATEAADEVLVSITARGALEEWGPCPWAPRVDDAGAAVYPATGDRALVLLDETGAPWIIAWEPA